MLHLESLSTPLKIADAVPVVEMLAIKTVYEDYAIDVVSNTTIMIASVSYATAASFLV